MRGLQEQHTARIHMLRGKMLLLLERQPAGASQANLPGPSYASGYEATLVTSRFQFASISMDLSSSGSRLPYAETAGNHQHSSYASATVTFEVVRTSARNIPVCVVLSWSSFLFYYHQSPNFIINLLSNTIIFQFILYHLWSAIQSLFYMFSVVSRLMLRIYISCLFIKLVLQTPAYTGVWENVFCHACLQNIIRSKRGGRVECPVRV